MWIFTTDGFCSVIEHYTDPSKVVVRGRCKQDLENLRSRLGSKAGNIGVTAGSDYRYRFEAKKADFANMMRDLIMNDISYGNFKNATRDDTPGRSRAYHKCWGAMFDFQHELTVAEYSVSGYASSSGYEEAYPDEDLDDEGRQT